LISHAIRPSKELRMGNRRIGDARWTIAAIVVGLIAAEARAQDPDPGAGAQPVCNRRGRLHRMFHHVAHTIEDKAVGYPDTFREPPLGYYINEQFAVQVAKADPHRFMLYRTDFLPGTNQFSPVGAARFNLMYSRLPGWFGPVLVEWTPDQPALAQSRREVVLATLERAGRPILADRVLIGPSPYPGEMGVEATNNLANTIGRSQQAATTWPLPPVESASMGVR
jgi:hypothetical protein